jgi:hypothetical protein
VLTSASGAFTVQLTVGIDRAVGSVASLVRSTPSKARPPSPPSPVFVAVRREAGFSGGCGSWIVTKPPGAVSPPPLYDDSWENWVAKNGAIDASQWAPQNSGDFSNSIGATNLDVTIQGRTATPVVLTGIEFFAVHRNVARITGGVVTNSCGGPMDARYMEVDLDTTPIKIVDSLPDQLPRAPGEPAWLTEPVEFPYDVTDTQGEVFKIIAYTRNDCAWYAKLFWSVDGQSGESAIGDSSNPFKTAAASHATVTYGYDGKRWYICPAGSEFNCQIH